MYRGYNSHIPITHHIYYETASKYRNVLHLLIIQNWTQEINVFIPRKLIPFTSLQAPSWVFPKRKHTFFRCCLFFAQSTNKNLPKYSSIILFHIQMHGLQAHQSNDRKSYCGMRASVWSSHCDVMRNEFMLTLNNKIKWKQNFVANA